METKAKRLLLILITFAASVGGAILRRMVLQHSMDKNRLLLEGGRGYLYALIALVLAALAAILVLIFFFQKRATLKGDPFLSLLQKILIGAAGVFIAVGSLMHIKSVSGDKLSTFTCILGIVGGLALLALAAVQMMDRRGSFLFLLPLCLWTAMQLVCDYKLWSKDPILVDYCFKVLSDITGMLAVFHIGGFFFDYGKRRLTIFWCAACTLFSAISLADCIGDTESFLHRLSLVVLAGCFLLQLVFCSKPERKDA